MWEAQAFVRRIGQRLHTKNDDIAREPLPERWVDLIRYLDKKERQASETVWADHGTPSDRLSTPAPM